MNTPSGIEIYDDEFTAAQRRFYFLFLKKSYFKIGEPDIGIPEHDSAASYYLTSEYSSNDLSRLGLLEAIKSPELIQSINQYRLRRCFVNLDCMKEVHYVHNHPEERVLLYYANLEWKPEWYGETIFYDGEDDGIIFANQYKPGRLIWFDGNIPHSFRPPSRKAPMFRLTLSFFFLPPEKYDDYIQGEKV